MQSNQITNISIWQLLPLAIITSAGSSFLAIALFSFFGVPIAIGLWLAIVGVLIFAQSHSKIEKIYLFVITLITIFGIIFIWENLYFNNLFQAGYSGILAILLLVIFVGLLAFTIIILSRIFNWLFSSAS